MNLLTVSFETVGNSEGKATLNDVMDVSKLTSFDVDAGEMDYIETWNMESGDWGKRYSYADLPEVDPSYAKTWLDVDVPVNPEVESGASLWLFHKGEDIESFCFAGQVTSFTNGYTLTKGKMNLCGNPLPTVLNLCDRNQVKIANATSFDIDEGEKDYVETWDLTTGDWGKRYSYVNLPDLDPSYADTWLDVDVPVATTAIQAGSGFWYYAAGDGTTLTFEPIK